MIIIDLLNELNDKTQELQISLKQLRKTGTKYAEAYTSYRIALAQELLRLKDNNTPATLCSDLARGNINVARKKFDEISNEAIYKANLESINSLKLQIRLIEKQLEREWSDTK